MPLPIFMTSKLLHNFILAFAVILAMGAIVSLLACNAKITRQQDYDVALEANSTDSTQTDVYRVNELTDQRTLVLTVDRMNRDHYHPAEWVNGTLYLVKSYESETGEWVEELWRFPAGKNGKVIYSHSGLDFRVDESDKHIAIISNSTDLKDSIITFIDTEGNTLKQITRSEIAEIKSDNALRPLFWQKDSFWFTADQAADTNHLGNINLTTDAITVYNISSVYPQPSRDE